MDPDQKIDSLAVLHFHLTPIDYKMAGKKVEVRESNDGSILLVYYQNTLIKQFDKA